ncbi:MAG TPA: NADH-ubiquinone oxidoreductase-F iron-sulfur binding region domain-containing protein [Acidimicrobiales bacterium]|nr:NADH-ubiquinone oxidoreductase-F iron-sulfur binding region domain-containing protein [Acidimicrobiales bacterium]
MMMMDSPAAPGTAPPPGPPRLLADLPPSGTWRTLAQHRAVYPAPPAPGRRPRTDLIDLVDASGLRGRGGAGFPTGRKLRTVASGRRRPVVVANGTEGEPASGKDRLLLARLPHLVLDGALVAAAAVGADLVVVCVDRHTADAVAGLRRALAERAGELAGVEVRLGATPPRYVAGEESALVHWVNGGPAKPTAVPPRPFEKGVDGRPTLVQNVESLAHVAQIARWGAEWFRALGPADDPGTMLVSVTGAVGRPCVLETPVGTPVRSIVDAAGGTIGKAKAVLMGGFFGTWVPAADALAAPFSRAGLSPLGAAPGAGIMVVLPEEACGVAETARVLGWYAAESAGQCGPCVFGLGDLGEVYRQLAAGRATPADVARLERWAAQINGRGGCRHPDGAVRLLRSAVGVFGDDVARHAHGQPCPARAPVLRVPRSTDEWR